MCTHALRGFCGKNVNKPKTKEKKEEETTHKHNRVEITTTAQNQRTTIDVEKAHAKCQEFPLIRFRAEKNGKKSEE